MVQKMSYNKLGIITPSKARQLHACEILTIYIPVKGSKLQEVTAISGCGISSKHGT